MSCLEASEQKLLVRANAENGFKKEKKEKRKKVFGIWDKTCRSVHGMLCMIYPPSWASSVAYGCQYIYIYIYMVILVPM